jgi:hypothetical protein
VTCQSCRRDRPELAFDVILSRRGKDFDHLDTVCLDCRTDKPWFGIKNKRERDRVYQWARRRRLRAGGGVATAV